MGLVGGIARTAIAAGTWTAVSNRVNRRQQNRWARQDQQAYQQPAGQYYQQPAPPAYQQPAPAPTAPAASAGGSDPVAALKGLADLKAQGILTDEEFTAAKARILAA